MVSNLDANLEEVEMAVKYKKKDNFKLKRVSKLKLVENVEMVIEEPQLQMKMKIINKKGGEQIFHPKS